MLKLDNSLLDELGLGGLPEEQKRSMLQHIYETLELRVGTNLANQMTDQQLEEFERFIDDGGDANQAQALQWLETNLPNYKQVVNDVFEALKVEIKQMAPQLMAASTAAPQVPGAAAPPAPAQQAYAPQPPAPATPAPNDYYGQPAPAAPYMPPVPQQPIPSAAPVPSDFGAPAPAANGFDMPSAPANDFAAPAAPQSGFDAPASQTPPASAGFTPDPVDPSAAASTPGISAPAGFAPLPADPIAGGQQQVVQPAPTPYDQPSMPFPNTPPAPQPPQDNGPAQPPVPQPPRDPQAPGQSGYQFPTEQPPAGPGNYPPQHPSR